MQSDEIPQPAARSPPIPAAPSPKKLFECSPLTGTGTGTGASEAPTLSSLPRTPASQQAHNPHPLSLSPSLSLSLPPSP